ncbi:MAG: phytanoyl-CoA dioxygenase family protein [Rhizobiales bacterium]|nr:phytanoyl-CoA dioxygenase family protein [Hyphomicrobiales bacterium]NRB13189.1 phytanoyl-CoA dioxygenase family protein [Hyphomicrobiales bacterium]
MIYTEENCLLDQFILHLDPNNNADIVYSVDVQKNVPIYDCTIIRDQIPDAKYKQNLMAEWAAVLSTGAGVFVLKQAFADTTQIDQATEVFQGIIAQERGTMGGEDHFAKSGANDRIWNALEKLCLQAPDVFAHYYANDMIALAAESWLGPAYQVTSQINVVRPGGSAQQPHCDYHLGFLTADSASHYPPHVHQLSQSLTLQGGVAHCDMSVASGPTKLLPFSQNYPSGYLAWRREDFKQYFENHYIQLPLAKGDAVFFNPALFHAAGANSTKDVVRMVNLLQISSAFGRAMETIDREKMGAILLPVLFDALNTGQLSEAEIINVIAASAEGYPFPTNLDTNPPVNGLAPLSQQQKLKQALKLG